MRQRREEGGPREKQHRGWSHRSSNLHLRSSMSTILTHREKEIEDEFKGTERLGGRERTTEEHSSGEDSPVVWRSPEHGDCIRLEAASYGSFFVRVHLTHYQKHTEMGEVDTGGKGRGLWVSGDGFRHGFRRACPVQVSTQIPFLFSSVHDINE